MFILLHVLTGHSFFFVQQLPEPSVYSINSIAGQIYFQEGKTNASAHQSGKY